jgi:hypothetical protein
VSAVAEFAKQDQMTTNAFAKQGDHKVITSTSDGQTNSKSPACYIP